LQLLPLRYVVSESLLALHGRQTNGGKLRILVQGREGHVRSIAGYAQ